MSTADLWRDLVPAEVVVAEARIDQSAPMPLLGAEEDDARSFAPIRRASFAAGRDCARRALSLLGHDPVAIPMNDRRPAWPDGIVGSISHSGDYCVAAVARASLISAIGVDVETTTTLSQPIAERVASASELAALPLEDRWSWAAVVFSAKESFYKLQHPLTDQFLGFEDARVALTGPSTFSVELLRAAGRFTAGQRFPGRYVRADDRIATAMVLPAAARAS